MLGFFEVKRYYQTKTKTKDLLDTFSNEQAGQHKLEVNFVSVEPPILVFTMPLELYQNPFKTKLKLVGENETQLLAFYVITRTNVTYILAALFVTVGFVIELFKAFSVIMLCRYLFIILILIFFDRFMKKRLIRRFETLLDNTV